MLSSITASVMDISTSVQTEICFVLLFLVSWLLVSKIANHSGSKLPAKGLGPSKKPSRPAASIGVHQQTNRARINAIKDYIMAGQVDEAVKEWRLGISMTSQAYEDLLSGHAHAGDQVRVRELFAQMQKNHQKPTARAHASVVKGFLQNGMLDAGMEQAQTMLKQGFYVPSFAIMQFLKLAIEQDRAEDLVHTVLVRMELPAEAVGMLFEDCAQRSDVALALKVETIVRSAAESGTLPLDTYASLLKVLVVAADPRAQAVFEEMQQLGAPMNNGFLANIIARCADSKFLCFAQIVADFCRARGAMTLPEYTAMAKVYSACCVHSQVCDLLGEMREQGLQPDAKMCSMLMKIAKAGLTDVSQALIDSMPQADRQQHMVLIQVAGRNKDIDRTFALLDNLRSSGLLDTAVYNCVLDACINAEDMGRAHGVMQEMKAKGMVDIVSYNTMLKGCIAHGNIKAAQELFAEIETQGLKPCEITYNCMVYTAVKSRDFRSAWEMVDEMENSGMKLDQYTVSIILQGLKLQNGKPRDVQRAMALLDNLSFDICSDGVPLSIALETAIKYGEVSRVQFLVRAWENSPLKPCAHTTASLVKAYSMLNRFDRCHDLWKQAVRERGAESNEILLGCLLDVLVSNDRVDEAITVFNEVRHCIPPNMVLYSTLAKGFATHGRIEEAMTLWREARASGAKLNSVLYNVLIDVQARQGAMEQVDELVEAMEEDGCEKSVHTFCIIVKGHCVNGDICRAFDVLNDMHKKGMNPDCVAYNTILAACVQHKRMDLADKTLADMKRSKVTPSSFTLAILVKMYAWRHRLDLAFAVVSEMKSKHGIEMNMQACTCLMTACIHNKDLDRAVELFEEMKGKGVDARAYAVLIDGFSHAGRVQEAVEAVKEAYGLRDGKRVLPMKQSLHSDCLERLFFSIRQQGLQEKYGMPLIESLRAINVPTNVLASILDERKSVGGGRPRGSLGRGARPEFS